MIEVKSFKMPFRHRLFNKRQRVWIRTLAGCAAECFGRHRGNGRWITAWVAWRKKEAPCIETFGVDAAFAKRISEIR